MSFKDFEYLLSHIEPAIRKQGTNYRDAISPKERLVITLRFLATGDSFSSLMYTFKVSKSSVSHIVHDVCRALNGTLNQCVHVSKSYEFSFFWRRPIRRMWFHWARDQFGGVPIWRGKKLGH